MKNILGMFTLICLSLVAHAAQTTKADSVKENFIKNVSSPGSWQGKGYGMRGSSGITTECQISYTMTPIDKDNVVIKFKHVCDDLSVGILSLEEPVILSDDGKIYSRQDDPYAKPRRVRGEWDSYSSSFVYEFENGFKLYVRRLMQSQFGNLSILYTKSNLDYFSTVIGGLTITGKEFQF